MIEYARNRSRPEAPAEARGAPRRKAGSIRSLGFESSRVTTCGALRSAGFSVVLTVLVALLGCAPTVGTIGAVLAQAPDGRLFVHETPQGLAAEREGLRPGDEILLIDGMDVRRMNEPELHHALSGDAGTTVRLTIVRGPEVIHAAVKRTPAPARERTGSG